VKVSLASSIDTDVLVLGGGGAGLRAAVAAAEAGVRVLVLSDTRVGYGSLTAVSGGAFASTQRSDPQGHFRDTVIGGRFLGDQDLALTLTQGIDVEAEQLAAYGAQYLEEERAPWLRHVIDPGHHCAVMVYGRSSIGTDITLPLRSVAESMGTRFIEGAMATRLIVEDGRALGAYVLTRDGQLRMVVARATILATGGMGQVYSHTDNTPGATGDGYCLAYEAGLSLRDMEFMQFYPVNLGTGFPGVYYEILVAGVEGRLINAEGDDVRQLHGLDDPQSLTRDYLSIAMMREVAAGRGVDGGVILDIEHVPEETLRVLEPVLPKAALRGQRRFNVVPTAHTHMGGVVVDCDMATSLSGLYAAGEVTGGVHGANRLGGNALSEVLVFGSIAGRSAAGYASRVSEIHPDEALANTEGARLESLAKGSPDGLKSIRTRLKEVMWHDAGVLRSEPSLLTALDTVSELERSLEDVGAQDGRGLQSVLKTRNMLLAGKLLCTAALKRTESRGAHWRQDRPESDDDEWLKTILVRHGEHEPVVSTRQVTQPYIQP